jgi:hypothetical protein
MGRHRAGAVRARGRGSRVQGSRLGARIGPGRAWQYPLQPSWRRAARAASGAHLAYVAPLGVADPMEHVQVELQRGHALWGAVWASVRWGGVGRGGVGGGGWEGVAGMGVDVRPPGGAAARAVFAPCSGTARTSAIPQPARRCPCFWPGYVPPWLLRTACNPPSPPTCRHLRVPFRHAVAVPQQPVPRLPAFRAAAAAARRPTWAKDAAFPQLAALQPRVRPPAAAATSRKPAAAATAAATPARTPAAAVTAAATAAAGPLCPHLEVAIRGLQRYRPPQLVARQPR